MAVRLGRIVALAGAVLALGVPAPVAAAAQRVLYVGDSLGVGTTPGLARELGRSAIVQGNSRVGRPSPEGLQVLEQLFSPSDDVVVFDLGTNDDPANPGLLASDLAAARRVAVGACMVVATMNRPPLNGYSVAGLNRAAEQFAARAPNVQLVDWHGYAQSDPSLLGPDHVHPTPQGYADRAQLFAQAVSSCAAGASAPAAPRGARRPSARASRPAPKPRPRRPAVKVPGIESSGISFSVPLRVAGGSAQLLLPNTNGPYPAALLIGAPPSEADVLAHAGVAALTYVPRRAPDVSAALAAMNSRREIVRDRIAVWGTGAAAAAVARTAAADPRIAAIVKVNASSLPAAELRDWRIRRALAAPAPAVTKWLRLRSGAAPATRWPRVSQPLYATWTRSGAQPARAEALALAQIAREGGSRDRTFDSAADESAAGAAATRWLIAHLKTRPVAVVDERLPPPDAPAVASITGASAIYSVPLQLAWLVAPALLLAAGARRRSRRGRSIAAAAGAGIASLGAIAGGVAAALDSGGRGIAVVAGLPWPFAVAFVLSALTVVATLALVRQRAYIAATGSALWVALALFWLL